MIALRTIRLIILYALAGAALGGLMDTVLNALGANPQPLFEPHVAGATLGALAGALIVYKGWLS